jgi:cobalamin synthase
VALAVDAGRGPGVITAAAALAGFAAVVALGWRRLGGHTGDVLGAAGVVAQTVGLLVAAARW